MKRINVEVPAPVNYIIQELEKCGHEAYMVGGCVRDSVLGRKPHDYDICTSATPDEILKAFPDEEIIPTGLQHGTVTILINKEPFEVTTYRIDGDYSDNRRPDNVTFTKNLVEDLRRRDFTINAMAYNPKTGLIDPFNGMEDIKYKKIRCVGSAEDRFNEDALRILRAIRFEAQLGFAGLPETMFEIERQYDRLKNISIERINSEFCKIVASEQFCVELVLYPNVFSLFIPELKDLIGFQQNNPYHAYDVFDHTVHAIEKCESDDLVVRLAVFFHDFGKPHSYQDGEDGIRHFKGRGKVSAEITDSIMKRLRFDNETRNNVVELVYYHDATFEVGNKYVKRWLNKIGEKQFRRLLEIRKADIKGQKPDYEESRIEKVNNIENILEEILSEKSCFSLKDLAVNGNDVKEVMKLKEGKDIGYWLNEILKRVIDGELENNKDDLVYWMTGVRDGWIKF
ncbi:CCA tRNA nucleotidyltransferase [Thomasclavelia cocleata]|jgi:tRNA nucleotidyltransferase (CCA-adding enzyme)|uniref:CCA tRNA nucleotidyltransferase n=1 Tax=Thomasclavelia cocleata TaxID=69824 RepID=UPI00255A7514|nr:HD domain-containing protein [Thomasclavelia cocleata]